jgi:hypothetical protein
MRSLPVECARRISVGGHVITILSNELFDNEYLEIPDALRPDRTAAMIAI